MIIKPALATVLPCFEEYCQSCGAVWEIITVSLVVPIDDLPGRKCYCEACGAEYTVVPDGLKLTPGWPRTYRTAPELLMLTKSHDS